MPSAPALSPPLPRRILHVDMDAFFASIEIRDRPELRGKPVIVGSKPTERGVVSTASYEARRYGVHSAMPSSEAGRLCPHGVFLPPDMPKYAAVSRRIFAIFGRYTPLVEGVSVDEAFLDVSGAGRLFGPPEDIGRRIKADILREEGLTCSVGVAANKYLAKLGSEFRKPDGLTVVPFDPDAAAAWLRPLPIGAVWGVGKVTREAFLRAGVRTVGDLQDLPDPALRAVVGPNMAGHFRDLAFGRDARPVETEYREKSIGREHTFPFDERSPEAVENCLFALVEDVAARLRADGRPAGTAKLKVRWGAGAFETLTRQRPFDPPTRLGRDLHEAARALWRGVGLRHPVRLVGFAVGLLPDDSAPRQLSLFTDPSAALRDRQERAERAADAIRAAHGADSLRTAREI